MKKSVVLLVLFSIFFISLASAVNQSDIDKGYQCLEDKVGDCGSLTTQELALTIMATPDNVFDDCVEELKSRKTGSNWGNVRDTALAVLALDHAGESTADAESWLLNQSRTPTDLEWYIQQDSNSATECVFSYNSQDYNVNIGDNKKIDNDAGTCLTRAQSNFWFRINPSCYEEDFVVECDKDFIGSLLYKSGTSETIHVLEGTKSSPAFGSITLSIKSKCFGTSTCEYEATAWAVTALLRTGHDISDFLPYLIAKGEDNERFLPNSFIYMSTNYNDYATELVSEVKLGNYWLATNSAYNKFYDTALALISLGSSSAEQVEKSKDWLVFSQSNDGCWQNSIRDTSIVLWALTGKSGKGGNGSSGSTTYCTQANYFCIPTADCPTAENVGANYFCPSLSETCCMTENLKACSVLGGSICGSNEVCVGNERKSLDSPACCTGECVERQEQTECEANFYTCSNSCSDSQEEVSLFACSGGQVCCKAKTTSQGSGSLWWLWLLIIILVIGILGWIFRERLKVLWAKLKTKFKKKGGSSSTASSTKPGPKGPGVPPAPIFTGRPRPPMVNTTGYRGYDRRDREMSDTFKRLRELSSK